MAKISILAFPAPGHSHGIQNLAIALQERGHTVTLYTPLDGVALFNAKGITIRTFAESALPMGSLKTLAGSTIQTSGLMAWLGGLNYLRILNGTLSNIKIDESTNLLLHDELYFQAHRSFSGKRMIYSQALSYQSMPQFIFLKRWIKPSNTHLLPYTEEFAGTPANAIHTGPWFPLTQTTKSKDDEYLYVSFGTLVDSRRKMKLIHVIQKVCEKNHIPTLISWGSWKNEAEIPISSSSMVKIFPRVDQTKVLSQARLMITHGGLNTVQECIWAETPMIVVPLKHDQHAIADRVSALGLGQKIEYKEFNETNLEKVLLDEWKQNRQALFLKQKQAIMKAGGISRAVKVIEDAI
jgi:UDP:flavonoid glycosyltransferase YjiC (YdhE family)